MQLWIGLIVVNHIFRPVSASAGSVDYAGVEIDLLPLASDNFLPFGIKVSSFPDPDPGAIPPSIPAR